MKTQASKEVPSQPEDWPGFFCRYLNQGDLNAVIDLYEPNARFIERSGDIVVGRDRIRGKVAELIKAKAELRFNVIRITVVDDIAQLYTDFDGTTIDESGSIAEFQSRAVEVLRRQANGSWLLIIGDPNGRK